MISTDSTINKKIKRKIYGIIGALLTLIIPFFLMEINDGNQLETGQSLCPFKMLTGFPCPSCGITKSLVYCYHGDLYQSLAYHVFGPFVILFCIVTIVVLTTEIITKKEYFNDLLFSKKLAYALAIFLIVYHLIRLVYFVNENSLDAILKQSIWR